ncbi:MAG: polysaccharide pyruvyl transferase CsaB [Bacillota bacterium]|nr:polysaccharide pyruvyl transferase CsaB [Bacillota bacterium]
MRKILLSGYYGYNNAGDEAILKSIIDNIRKIDPASKITVLTDNVKFTKEKYRINAVKRFNPFHLLRALLECDILISGGGTLFQDRTSTRSLIYYTAIINLAKFFGKKVMIYANGMGPLSKPSNIARVKKTIENSDIVTLRDEESMEFVRGLRVRNQNIFLTTDPVFSLSPGDEKTAREILAENALSSNRDFVVVSVRSWEREEEFTALFAKTCDYIAERYQKDIVFIPMQYPHDLITTDKIRAQMREASRVIEQLDTTQMLSVIGQSAYVLSMRLHGLIFAGTAGIPCLGFSYDPKIERLLKQIEMPCASRIEEMSFADMKKSVDDMEEHLEDYRLRILEKREEILSLSHHNLEYMRFVFNRSTP